MYPKGLHCLTLPVMIRMMGQTALSESLQTEGVADTLDHVSCYSEGPQQAAEMG